mmetsp:Transcript_102840/g.261270  ORF Transcript_102840/g.261270 Transcript_102840/m.261270 type:complete len:406 (-) Transcript_102840:24-1241(-)
MLQHGQGVASIVQALLLGDQGSMALGAHLEVLEKHLLELALAGLLLLLQVGDTPLEGQQNVPRVLCRLDLRIDRGLLVNLGGDSEEGSALRVALRVVVFLGLILLLVGLGLLHRARLLCRLCRRRLCRRRRRSSGGGHGGLLLDLGDIELGPSRLRRPLVEHAVLHLRVQHRELPGLAVIGDDQRGGHEVRGGAKPGLEGGELRAHQGVGVLDLVPVLGDRGVLGLERLDLLGHLLVPIEHHTVSLLLVHQLLFEYLLLLRHPRSLLLLHLSHSLFEGGGLGREALCCGLRIVEQVGYRGKLREAIRSDVGGQGHGQRLLCRAGNRCGGNIGRGLVHVEFRHHGAASPRGSEHQTAPDGGSEGTVGAEKDRGAQNCGLHCVEVLAQHCTGDGPGATSLGCLIEAG